MISEELVNLQEKCEPVNLKLKHLWNSCFYTTKNDRVPYLFGNHYNGV